MNDLNTFITENAIEMQATKLARRPDGNAGFGKDATHWQIVFTIVGRGHRPELVTYYSMGSAHKGKPKIEDVLDCLASDASGVENARNFEDWASEYGYDTDSRSAERVYNACVKAASELREFLGRAAYDELLWNTERQ